MNTNVVDLIKIDHRELERLFDQLQSQPDKRPSLVPVMLSLLTAHSRAEEAEVYPVAAEAGIAEDVEHSQKEHFEAEQLAVDVAQADPLSPGFSTRLNKLIDAVRHHVEEEESTVLPGMREHLSRAQLDALGLAFLARRGDHLGDKPGDTTRAEMEQQAVNANLSGASSMSKSELTEELRSAAEQ